MKCLQSFVYVLLLFSYNAFAAQSREDNVEELEKLKNDVIESLTFEYKDQRNTNASEAQDTAINWLVEFDIIKKHDTESIDKIKKAAFSEFIGKVHPRADREKLVPVVLFAIWLFLYDDLVEKKPTEKDVETFHERTMKIINREATSDNDPFTLGLHDIMARFDKLGASSAWKERFSRRMADYCKATKREWKLAHQEKKQITVSDYRKDRLDTSGTLVMFLFFEPLEGINIAEDTYKGELFREMLELGADIVNITNDIVSSVKEFLENKNHPNLVFVHKAIDNISYKEAFQRAKNDLVNSYEKFMKLSEKIPKNDTDLRKYYDCILEWAAGHHKWAVISARYKRKNVNG